MRNENGNRQLPANTFRKCMNRKYETRKVVEVQFDKPKDFKDCEMHRTRNTPNRLRHTPKNRKTKTKTEEKKTCSGKNFSLANTYFICSSAQINNPRTEENLLFLFELKTVGVEQIASVFEYGRPKPYKNQVEENTSAAIYLHLMESILLCARRRRSRRSRRRRWSGD